MIVIIPPVGIGMSKVSPRESGVVQTSRRIYYVIQQDQKQAVGHFCSRFLKVPVPSKTQSNNSMVVSLHYNVCRAKWLYFSSHHFEISHTESNEDTGILSLEPSSNLGYSSLRPLSPLLESSISRNSELLPSSSDDPLDPKSFLTPLNTVQIDSSVLQNEELHRTPAFTITPLVNLDEEHQEPDSTTFESCLGKYFNHDLNFCLLNSDV